jgi:hypothetical protein
MGPPHQPHGLNNNATRANRGHRCSVTLGIAVALSPPAATCAAIFQLPTAAIKGAPLQMEQPFPPALPVTATAPSHLPSLSCREPPPRFPSEPPDTSASSTPTPGAPSTSLPAPSARPLLHRCHSPLLGLHHRGTHHSGEPSPLFDCQTGPPPCRLALRPFDHRPPAASRPDFAGKSPVPTGEKASPVSSRAERLRWAGPLRSR